MSATDSVDRRITMQEIAAHAGVSVSTVSRALQNSETVSERTRRLIQSSARELGYTPVGRAGVPAPPSIIMVYDSFGHDEYGTVVFSGAMAAASENGLRTIVDYSPGTRSHTSIRGWVRSAVAQGARAAILIAGKVTDTLIDEAEAAHLYLVAVDPKQDGSRELTTIGGNSWAGAASVATHLVELGHRRIAMAGLDPAVEHTVERFSGLRSVLELAGVPLPPEYIGYRTTDLPDKFQAGVSMGMAFANLETPPTAVFAASDTLAFGVIEGARRAGLDTPRDLSVVGFDDLPAARHSSPPLTTVRQPLVEIGALAVRTALDASTGDAPPTPHLQLATTLIVRASTAPPLPQQ